MNPRVKNNAHNDFPTNPGHAGGGSVGTTASGESQARFDLLPKWQRERAHRLHVTCQRVHAALTAGKTWRHAFSNPVRTARKAYYRSEPRRKVHLSRSSLERLYSVWKRGGKSPLAFILKYRSKLDTTARRRAALAAASAPGITTTGNALRKLAQAHGITERSLRRCLTTEIIAELRRLHRARITHAAAEARFKQFAGKLT